MRVSQHQQLVAFCQIQAMPCIMTESIGGSHSSLRAIVSFGVGSISNLLLGGVYTCICPNTQGITFWKSGCASHRTTNDTYGRIFEFLVIKHCSINANVTFSKRFSALKKCNLIETFLQKSTFPLLIDTHPSNVLPEIMKKMELMFPKTPIFLY